jgi:hypothetical protein
VWERRATSCIDLPFVRPDSRRYFESLANRQLFHFFGSGSCANRAFFLNGTSRTCAINVNDSNSPPRPLPLSPYTPVPKSLPCPYTPVPLPLAPKTPIPLPSEPVSTTLPWSSIEGLAICVASSLRELTEQLKPITPKPPPHSVAPTTPAPLASGNSTGFATLLIPTTPLVF